MVALQDPQFVVIEQRIAAGSDWNGAAPALSGTPLVPDFTTKGVKSYAEGDEGGLFEWDFQSFFLIEVQQIKIDFNGVANKSVLIRKSGAPDMLVFDSTNGLETNIVITDRFQLAVDEKLVIVSSGAVNAMYARAIARPLHPEPSTTLGG